MEIRHISRKKKNKLLKWFEDCGIYESNSLLDLMPNLDDSQYKSLRKQGDKLLGNYEALCESVRTPKAKNEKILFMKDIDEALNILEDCHKRRKCAEDIKMKL